MSLSVSCAHQLRLLHHVRALSPIVHQSLYHCQYLRAATTVNRSSFHLGFSAGSMQAEEKEEDLIGAIEVELASIKTCLMDTAALFEALTLVDLMERLGIQTYFEHQIQRILRTTNMQWDEKYGLKDAKATVLAFRLLRLHGYPVSA